jgi:Xaa-Pro aminopeptidase
VIGWKLYLLEKAEVNMATKSSLQKLQELILERGTDVLVLCPSANWRYLYSFVPISADRPTFIVVTHEHICAIVPDFDQIEFKAKTQIKDVFGWNDVHGPADAVRQAWETIGGSQARTVALDDTMPYLYFKALEPHVKSKSTTLAGPLLMELRVIKDENEIDAIRATSVLIENVLGRCPRIFRPGMTEREAEAKLRMELLAEGADTLDYILVQACPNSASPHHVAGSTVINKGAPVLLDIGVSKGGYYSDITRNVCLGKPSTEYERIFRHVRESQEAGVECVRPGIPVGDIHKATSGVYEKAGVAEFFTTRTGHGLGLEIHEPPSVAGGNPTILKPGMVFTIEPGLYIDGKFGVRIEDTVVVRDHGAERLTTSDRDLMVI